jgi:hypothetical protein
MSLDWRLDEIENHEELWVLLPKGTTEKDFQHMMAYRSEGNGKAKRWKVLNSKTNGIIWTMMGLGMGEITKDNWKEFATRLKMWQDVIGPVLCGRKDNRITTADVKRNIGLWTNVFPKESLTAFAKKLFWSAKKDIEYEVEETESKVKKKRKLAKV